LTVHELPAQVIDPATRRSGRIKMILLLLICSAPVVASYFTYYVLRPQGRSNYGTLVTPKPLPASSALALHTEQGQAVDPQSLRGQWLLVVVGDGACDTQCEQLLYTQRQLRETLGKEMDRVDRVWLVTGDAPVRPALLPALAKATVLHVQRDALAAWLEPDPGHTLDQQLYLVDPMGNWMMRFPARFDPGRVKRDLERLLRASAAWDLPGR
jgi:cytochrome oxidase Cu insertion factor (SCO1/SenC/PrrC family)